MNGDFNSIYDKNKVMKIIGYQSCCEYVDDNFRAVLDAHRESNNTNLFNVALDFYLLGIVCGKRAERAKKQRKEYRPILKNE